MLKVLKELSLATGSVIPELFALVAFNHKGDARGSRVLVKCLQTLVKAF